MARPDSKRALRRHHTERIMTFRYKRYKQRPYKGNLFEVVPVGVLRNEDIRAKCSCDYCVPDRFAVRRNRLAGKHFTRIGWHDEYDGE